MNWVLGYKEEIEIVYMICSGPILAIVALFALRQIKIAREALKVTSKRDAYRASAEQVRHYLNEIIPEINVLNNSIKDNNIDFFDKANVTYSDKEIKVSAPLSLKNKNELILIIPQINKVLNGIESFSLVLVSGVASEEVVFSSVGMTYVNTVKRLMPFISFVYESGYYKNTIILYKKWSDRIELLEAEKNYNDVLKKQSNVNIDKIIPIGV
ncbi:hypothetical protein ACJKIH_02115 [Brucella pseudogrignonensis]|uniref:DUF4760 domain-containing protein n=1 Tax=Brucella pseudogrignonensis TaxID=419475 RepID=UPI0038B6766C